MVHPYLWWPFYLHCLNLEISSTHMARILFSLWFKIPSRTWINYFRHKVKTKQAVADRYGKTHLRNFVIKRIGNDWDLNGIKQPGLKSSFDCLGSSECQNQSPGKPAEITGFLIAQPRSVQNHHFYFLLVKVLWIPGLYHCGRSICLFSWVLLTGPNIEDGRVHISAPGRWTEGTPAPPPPPRARVSARHCFFTRFPLPC